MAETTEDLQKFLDVNGGLIGDCPNCNGLFGTDQGDGLYDDSIASKEAQKRILEKAIERLEGFLDIARRGLGPESYDYDHGMNIALEKAIAELKSLMEEV